MGKVVIQHQPVVDARQQLDLIERKAKLARALEGPAHRLAAGTLMIDQGAAQSDLQHKLAMLFVPRIGKLRDLTQSVAKMPHYLGERVTTRRQLRSLEIVDAGFVRLATFGKMPCHQLRLRPIMHEALGQTQVDRAPAITQEGGISSILHQRMRERVSRRWRLATRQDDAR